MAENIADIRKMLAELAKVTGLTFDEVDRGGDLIISTGADAYERTLASADADPAIATFDQTTPKGELSGVIRSAILAKSPCVEVGVEDDDHTVHSAIVITTSGSSGCLAKTIERTLGLRNPTGQKQDAVALCMLYAGYRRFARTFDDLNSLSLAAGMDCDHF